MTPVKESSNSLDLSLIELYGMCPSSQLSALKESSWSQIPTAIVKAILAAQCGATQY